MSVWFLSTTQLFEPKERPIVFWKLRIASRSLVALSSAGPAARTESSVSGLATSDGALGAPEPASVYDGTMPLDAIHTPTAIGSAAKVFAQLPRSASFV